jgi:hypothetical protein
MLANVGGHLIVGHGSLEISAAKAQNDCSIDRLARGEVTLSPGVQTGPFAASPRGQGYAHARASVSQPHLAG